jgi:3',5'-cyclic AMP phosphodiesterase CpdA
MRLVCISDTHLCHRGLSLPDGDVLLHAGDATRRGISDEVNHFLEWFASQRPAPLSEPFHSSA